MSRAIQYRTDAHHRVLIVTNPLAGAGVRDSAVSELIDRITADGYTAELTSDLEQVQEVGGRPEESRLRAVVAAGGDGTVAEVVNRTHPDTPIAILPLGTENLLAKYLHMLVTPRAEPRNCAWGNRPTRRRKGGRPSVLADGGMRIRRGGGATAALVTPRSYSPPFLCQTDSRCDTYV